MNKEAIKSALAAMSTGDLLDQSKNLLAALGYQSERTLELSGTVGDFFQEFPALNPNTKTEREFRNHAKSVKLVFQFTSDEIANTGQSDFFDNEDQNCFLFCVVELKDRNYSRTKYAEFTREINKRLGAPTVVLFRVTNHLTIGFTDRRPNQIDPNFDVLGQVKLIKDIDLKDPHRAHLDILSELSLEECARWINAKKQPKNFDGLLAAWLARLDIEELNKRFYRELSNWYFWAVDNVTFPEDAGEDIDIRNATSVIRLITRLIFVWFIKEKKLIPDIFFHQKEIEQILVSTHPQESTYYKAILQNLFFATLNQEMNTPQKSNNRKFRGEGRQHHNITSLYRYKKYFTDPDEVLLQFETIPFLNGGLFECLDKKDKDNPKKILRIDGFSDRDDNQLSVPNFLFFSGERNVDLNAAYGTTGKQYKVRGLIEILRRHKFTVTENTPIEEEVALDPELLGRVFENLLAAYNPETGETARKLTGSFYTPREIVNYMVDESIITYLRRTLIAYYESLNTLSADPIPKIESKLHDLIAYNDKPHQFNESEIEQLINAIDTLKILDPACGSGAFPMGILHKLVFILGKLDPGNNQWKERQIDRVKSTIRMAEKIDDSTVRENTIQELETEIDNINEAFARNELDYGRKLYLIENCIYGTDIQPIAAQISKLRFFISLIVNQQIDDSRENRSVRPLPNLETKFIASNTLLGITGQLSLRSPEIIKKEEELNEVRRRHFAARTPRTKEKYRKRDAELRKEISELLKSLGLQGETAQKIASWDPYNQNAIADWFDTEWMFGFTNGFDIVIGNPPYLKEQNNKSVFEPVIKNQWGKKWHQGKMDYWYFFLHKAIDIVNNSGIISYITSRYWLNSAGAKKLIHRVRDELSFVSFADIGKLKVFDEVAGQHMVAVYVKDKDRDIFTYKKLQNNLIDLNKNENTDNLHLKELKNSTIYSNQNEILVEGGQLRFKNVIRLGEICDVSQGVVEAPDRVSKKALDRTPQEDVEVGDGVFVLTQNEIDSLELNEKEKRILKKYLNPVNVFRYGIKYDNKYLIYSDKEIKKIIENDGRFNQLKNHLDKFQRLITSSNAPYGIHRPRKDKYFIFPKIIFKNMFKQPEFTYDTSEFFFGFSFSSIIEKDKNYDLKYILAVLNSNFALYWYQRNCKKRGAGFDVGVGKIRDFPIAKILREQQKPLITLVDKILAITKDSDYLKNADKQIRVQEYEKQINKLVYKLYDLREEELK